MQLRLRDYTRVHTITRVYKIDNPHSRLNVKNATNDSNFSKNTLPLI